MSGDRAKVQKSQRVQIVEFRRSDFERNTWWTGTFVRFFVIPTSVTLFLTSGVYWLHRMPSGAPALDNGAIQVEVRLLPAPRPTPFVQPAGAPVHHAAHAAAIAQAADEDVPDDKFSTPPVQNLASDEPFAGPDDGRLQPTDSAEDPAAEYGRALFRHLARFQNYPAAARDAKLEGTVQLIFVMRRDGSVVSAWVGTSSGAEILDQEAMAILRRAEPLPAVPDKVPVPLNIKWPVVFRLPNSG